jgi:hypothetical protein
MIHEGSQSELIACVRGSGFYEVQSAWRDNKLAVWCDCSKKKKLSDGVREFERSAHRELFSVLRLVDAGKVTVSYKTCSLSPSSLPAPADTLWSNI